MEPALETGCRVPFVGLAESSCWYDLFMDEPRSTIDLTDADLIRRVGEGETEALDLIRPLRRFVYANAFRMSPYRSRAQD